MTQPTLHTGTSEAERLIATFFALAVISSPSGRERACGEWVTGELRNLDLEVRCDGAGASVGSDGDNLYCRVPPTVPGRSVFLCTHLDTVPEALPVEPVIVDGIIRNATPSIVGADNKAAVAVVLETVRAVIVEQRPHPGIELVFTIGEEQGLRGSTAFDTTMLQAATGFVLDHPGQIGGYVASAPSRFVVRAAIHGRAAHTGLSAAAGRNAVLAAVHAIANFPASPPGLTANVTRISGGNALNIVPDRADLAVDVRATDHDAGIEYVAELERAVEHAVREKGCSVDIEVANPYAAYRLPDDSGALALARSGLRVLELTAEPLTTHGGSDANTFRARGLDCINLNHGVFDFHGPDERVAVADLVLMKRLLLEIIAAASQTR